MMASSSRAPILSSCEAYRQWARSYDTEQNPMLTLERRYLEPLLPDATGLDVVDLGCGTGRWLEILKKDAPRKMLGVDFSFEMLQQAKRKLSGAATLLCADSAAVPLEKASADLVLGTFVLSYIEDAGTFLANARSALRECGSFFLTDVHPGTSASLQWRRGVRSETGFQEIQTFERSIDAVIELCNSAGLELCTRVEPSFGDVEREIFAGANKLYSWEQAAGYPAIYILQFRHLSTMRVQFPKNVAEPAISKILNAQISVGPRERISGTLNLSDSRITALCTADAGPSPARCSSSTIDVDGYLLLPGLVNAHDHLEFALFPRLGAGGYENCVEWAEDIHRTEAAVIARHRQVPKDVRLWWGAIRNLLCGATTVCHHNPYDTTVFDSEFAVRVVREFGWAHSLSMDPDAVGQKRRTPRGQPFLIHLGEGAGKGSEDEIWELHRAGGLDKDTVVIHGLALGKEGRTLLRDAGAGLIWCPSSNQFLFGRTLSADVIESYVRVALGNDSPLTAEGDLLDEVRFAIGASHLPVEKIYNCVTRQAARLLRLRQGQGTLRVGGVADIVAVRDKGQSPAETLAALSYLDVELALIGGRVHLASDDMLKKLPAGTHKRLEPIMIENVWRWVRAPVNRLFRNTAAHLPEGIFLGGKQVSLASQ